jgi:hypothetical protein
MRGRRKLLLFAGICAGLMAASNASAAIMLDVGLSSPVQAGWTAVDKYNDYAHAVSGSYLGPVNLGGGVTAGFANAFNATAADRGQAAIEGSPLHALVLDNLLRDYGGFSNAGGGVYTLYVKGLTPGDYNVTVYSADPNYPNETRALAVNGTVVTFDPFGSSPTLAMIAKTVTVTVDATGEMAITRPVGYSAPCKFSGFVIAPVPEPVTLVILLSGIGLVVVRRRR